jgi:hypothetical protein
MPSPLRRHALVLLLILAAGGAETAVAYREQPIPPLPAVTALMAGSGWQVEAAYQPGGFLMSYQQWAVRDAVGDEVLLYVGATARLQTALHWTGELGYQGEGFQVAERGERILRLEHGRTAAVARALVDHLSDHRVLEYAVASRDGVTAHITGSLLRTVWEALRGEAGPYYLVRVSMAAGGGPQAGHRGEQLLASVLGALVATARSGSGAPAG